MVNLMKELLLVFNGQLSRGKLLICDHRQIRHASFLWMPNFLPWRRIVMGRVTMLLLTYKAIDNNLEVADSELAEVPEFGEQLQGHQ
jgi:hypothetical protein